MNTKIIMSLSAIILGIAGLALTFLPDLVLSYIHLDLTKTTLFLMQILGALYFAFGMLNWMVKGSIIGGIYNRPIAMANFAHFSIAGLALLKGLLSGSSIPPVFWATGIIYMVFGLLFGIILFRHPIQKSTIDVIIDDEPVN